jgi:hypothetical protein
MAKSPRKVDLFAGYRANIASIHLWICITIPKWCDNLNGGIIFFGVATGARKLPHPSSLRLTLKVVT